jgi:mycothiol synthase
MSLRPYREDDFDPLLDLFNRHQLAAFGEADATADDLQAWLTTPYVDVERDIRVLERDGRVVGYADVDASRDEPPRWWCDVKVDPDVDADEAVRLLVDWIDERAGAAGGTVRVWTSETDNRVTGAFGALGFEPVRHSYRMEIGLEGGERAPAWPQGIDVRTVRDDEHQRVYEAVLEVWRDTSDPIDETFDEWAHWTIRHPSFDPSLWFLAESGGELAGFSLCREDSTDPNAGYVASLGVLRGWRRQGLGEALLLHSFAAFRERGWTRGTLGVDASSPTGATRLYERAGMRVYRDTVFMERPVGGAA